MALDLESLRTAIQAHLLESGIPVFYGYHRMLDTMAQVSWDTARRPDYQEFLATARAAGAKLVVFNYDAFSLSRIDEALEELEDCDFPREEKRNYELRLRQLEAYEGFTSSLQLSFALDNRVYLFELHTEWFEALADILGEIEAALEEREDEEEQGPLGRYFSNN